MMCSTVHGAFVAKAPRIQALCGGPLEQHATTVHCSPVQQVSARACAQCYFKRWASGNGTVVQVLLVWLVYVYLAMAARESLLLMNGSNIRPWWIWHHYLSALTCLIWLSLPVDSPLLQQCMRGWLAWSVLQGVLMIFQNMCARCLRLLIAMAVAPAGRALLLL